MSYGIPEDELNQITPGLDKEMNEFRDYMFFVENKRQIMYEFIYRKHNVCSACGGKGGRHVAIYHDDVEFQPCLRCKGDGRYHPTGMDDYFRYIE